MKLFRDVKIGELFATKDDANPGAIVLWCKDSEDGGERSTTLGDITLAPDAAVIEVN